MRLVFMGSPDFSVPILDGLLAAGHRIVCVYSQPPRPVGRGQRQRRVPVDEFAHSRGLNIRTPSSLKDAEEHAAFVELAADAAVVAAYGLILPAPILQAPRLGCLNVHASLLPRWRGAAPIQQAILAGDAETGVTIMQMDEGLDTGAILLAQKTPISAEMTTPDLHDRLAELGRGLIVRALRELDDGTLKPTPQPGDGVTYAPRLERAHGRLDWTRPAVELERMVRALNPWPGVWFELDGQRIKVLAADAVDAKPGVNPGTVMDDALSVACGSGALRLTRIQRPGKSPMDADVFLMGYALPRGSLLS